MYGWHFVNRLANHFSHLAFRRSRQSIGIFTKHQRGRTASFSSSFSQKQRWTKSAILWEAYSDWFAISWNSSRNSARTCRNARNDKCIASSRVATATYLSKQIVVWSFISLFLRQLVTQSSIAATPDWKAVASCPSEMCHCILFLYLWCKKQNSLVLVSSACLALTQLYV